MTTSRGGRPATGSINDDEIARLLRLSEALDALSADHWVSCSDVRPVFETVDVRPTIGFDGTCARVRGEA